VKAEPCSFEGDYNAIHSVLINLVDNGIDACRVDKKETDHRVSLSATCDGKEIRFEVTDNGLGMDQETREKAFSLFFTSKGAEGTGLGLFIANKMVVAHEGTIAIESTPEEGSRFLVRVPARKPEEAADAAAS
jgi:signal transduction histidine kinase